MTSVPRLVARWKLRGCTEVGEDPSVRGRIWFPGAGQVRIGARVVLDGSRAPIELHANLGAQIVIGDDVYIGGGTSIEARSSVVIGDRVRVGEFTKILDNHFHPVRGDRHQAPPSVEIRIEDDVRIEPRAILLPGTWLQRGVVVCAGAVVSRRIPEGALVAGLPAAVRPKAAR